MADARTPLATALGFASAAVAGAALPLLMVPSTKSSPLVLGCAAVLALCASITAGLGRDVSRSALRAATSPFGIAAVLLLAFMAASVPFAHAPGSSAGQFGQFAAALAAGCAFALVFPWVAPRNRAILFAAGVALTAAIVLIDLNSGLWVRKVTGGRVQTYSYNRALVTLTVLLWPALALIVASRKLWLVAPLAALLPFAVVAGDSGTAVVALAAGALVFPIAAFLPRTVWFLGLGGTLALLAVQPWIGSIMKLLLGQAFHQRFENAHSGDRVDIWLSFEAAARAKWLFGNGFGSSLNMQNAPVAALVPPERVTLLGASHPHNAFLQIWVELGLVGASLAAVLIMLLFRVIASLRPALQPFALTSVAVVVLVAFVSHGAWQAWWWAAILAAVASFAALESELRRSDPPL